MYLLKEKHSAFSTMFSITTTTGMHVNNGLFIYQLDCRCSMLISMILLLFVMKRTLYIKIEIKY